MNLLFLSELFYPHGGGAELATYLWAKLLAETGYRVRVITNRFRGEESCSTQDGFTVYRLPIFADPKGSKYVLLTRPDIAFSTPVRKLINWSDLVYVPRLWYSAILASKSRGKIVITHLHDYAPVCALASAYDISRNRICESGYCRPRCIIESERVDGQTPLETLGSSALGMTIWQCARRFVALSDAVICVSAAQLEIVAKRFPFLGRRCRVVYNPLPESFGLNIVGKAIGYLGGPRILKGFGVLSSALGITKSRSIIHMTGFSDQAISTGKAGVFLHGKLGDLDFRRMYEQFRAIVVPSIWPEPAPYVAAEALLSGRLLVASRVGGLPEMTQDCPGVFLFDAGDTKRLSECIDFISSMDEDTALDLGAANREAFLERFNNQNSLRNFLDVLDDMRS